MKRGETIRIRRKAEGIKQSELAARLNIGCSTLCAYELKGGMPEALYYDADAAISAILAERARAREALMSEAR